MLVAAGEVARAPLCRIVATFSHQCVSIKVMTIDRAGFPFIGVALTPAIASIALGHPLAAFLLVALPAAVTLFFRDPERFPPRGPGAVVSPADGRVLTAGAAKSTVAPPGHWHQISIFLSPLDVHVNRVPIGGTVTQVVHTRGRFLPAYSKDAATDNERSEVWLQHDNQTVVFRQVVGALARRVVCRVVPGAKVQTGERFGIMKFGSRMDLFLPTSATLLATEGERVRAGETVIARLPDSESFGNDAV